MMTTRYFPANQEDGKQMHSQNVSQWLGERRDPTYGECVKIMKSFSNILANDFMRDNHSRLLSAIADYFRQDHLYTATHRQPDTATPEQVAHAEERTLESLRSLMLDAGLPGLAGPGMPQLLNCMVPRKD